MALSKGVGSKLSGNISACIDSCLKCVQACESCGGACLTAPEMLETMNECVRRTRDTADASALCARLLARDSELSISFCVLVAAAAERCASECGKFPDEHCRECRAACLNCAEACRKVAERLATDAG